jgi:hypothetical protein
VTRSTTGVRGLIRATGRKDSSVTVRIEFRTQSLDADGKHSANERTGHGTWEHLFTTGDCFPAGTGYDEQSPGPAGDL